MGIQIVNMNAVLIWLLIDINRGAVPLSLMLQEKPAGDNHLLMTSNSFFTCIWNILWLSLNEMASNQNPLFTIVQCGTFKYSWIPILASKNKKRIYKNNL